MIRFNDGNDIREELMHADQPCTFLPRSIPQAAIQAKINGITVMAILDTGASVNAISAALMKRLQENKELPTLPVANCRILNAVGGRSRAVRLQTRIQMNVGNGAIQCTCLIVPDLVVDLIIGHESLREMKAVLNFASGELLLHINGEPLTVNLIRKQESHGRYCQSPVIKCIGRNTMNQNNQPSANSYNLIVREEIKQKVEEANALVSYQKQQLQELLQRYIQVFDEKPGIIKGYSCHLNVAPHKTYCHKYYSVPWALKSATDHEIQRMLAWGIIEPSNSQYCSPLHVVRKADGSVHLDT